MSGRSASIHRASSPARARMPLPFQVAIFTTQSYPIGGQPQPPSTRPDGAIRGSRRTRDGDSENQSEAGPEPHQDRTLARPPVENRLSAIGSDEECQDSRDHGDEPDDSQPRRSP